MKNIKTENPGEIKDTVTAVTAKKQVKKTVDNHRQAAAHHTEAANHHLDAARHYEAGNDKKAAQSTLLAHGHHALAGDFLNDNARHHAQVAKETNHNL
jgi:hypothetical protein